MRFQRAEHPLELAGPDAARRFFAGCFREGEPTRERLIVAHLDRHARCIHLSLHDGDEGGAELPLRRIIADAAIHGSAGLLLAHNHPSGDPQPSRADCRATRRLADAADALGCAIVDHMVFAGEDCTSFRAMGLL